MSVVVAEQTACASVRQSWMQKHSLGRGFSEHGTEWDFYVLCCAQIFQIQTKKLTAPPFHQVGPLVTWIVL